MPDSRWKATERRIAALLSGARFPVTGRQRGAASDVLVQAEWSGDDEAEIPRHRMPAEGRSEGETGGKVTRK